MFKPACIYSSVLIVYFFVCCSKSSTQKITWDVDASALSLDTLSIYPYLLQSDLIFQNGIIMSIDPQNADAMFVVDTRTGQKWIILMKMSEQYIAVAVLLIYPATKYRGVN